MTVTVQDHVEHVPDHEQCRIQDHDICTIKQSYISHPCIIHPCLNATDIQHWQKKCQAVWKTNLDFRYRLARALNAAQFML